VNRTLLVIVALLVPLLVVSRAGANEAPYTFSVACDLQNADITDDSLAKGWRPGDPNGIDDQWRQAVRDGLGDLSANAGGAKDLVVCGDIPEGHWGRDDLRTGIFGPTDTEAHRVTAVKNAAGRVYSFYKGQMAASGLTVFPVIGDHEIGDNPWGNGSAYQQFKRRNMYVFKQRWAHYFTADGKRFADHPRGTNVDDTAYATMLSPDVMLVGVDMFTRTRDNVDNVLGGGELRWLDTTLAKARARGVKWIVVEGHDPVLGPVRYRHSSRQMYRGGQSSAFWATMRRHHVDVYLCGEVHDTTAIVPDDGGPVQISSGGLFYQGQWGYLNATVTGDRLQITDRNFPGAVTSTADGYLWQTERAAIVPADVDYSAPSEVRGTMTIDRDGTVPERSGSLDVYQPVS